MRIKMLGQFPDLRHINKNKLQILVLAIVSFQLLFPSHGVLAQGLVNDTQVKSLVLVNTAAELANDGSSVAPGDKIRLVFPRKSSAVVASVVLPPEPDEVISPIEPVQPIAVPQEMKVVKTYKMTVTAYSSTVDQTDSDPCSTANGFNLCDHNQEDVIAANFLKFGTKVRIPQYFGDRVFTVQDRMNARYFYRADVWFKTREAAKTFGAHYATVEVLE